MRPGHLAPDDADLGAAHLLLTPVDIRNPLSQVEAISRVNSRPSARPVSGSRNVLGSSGVIDALDLDEAGLGVGGVAATLIAQVATPMQQFTVSPSIPSPVGPSSISPSSPVAFVASRLISQGLLASGSSSGVPGCYSLDVYYDTQLAKLNSARRMHQQQSLVIATITPGPRQRCRCSMSKSGSAHIYDQLR